MMAQTPKPPLKIAFIRLSAMGDIIHSASLLPLLHEHLSSHFQAKITWFVDLQFAEILKDCPFIDSLISLPLKASLKQKNLPALLSLYRQLKSLEFDIVIDLQGLLKSALVGKILKTKQFWGFDSQSIREPLASIFYTHKIKIPYQEHILLRNATLAFGALNLPIPTLEMLLSPKIFLGLSKNPLPFTLSQETKTPKILCVLETSKPNKTYPIEHFLTLAALLKPHNITPYFLTHTNTPQEKGNFIPLNHLNLEEVKTLLSQMDLVIGGDTGITHLAWALKRPSITLFGATPSQRFHLKTNQNLYLSANKKTNYQKDDFSIATILPNAIYELIQTLLKLPEQKTLQENLQENLQTTPQEKSQTISQENLQ